ncbi:ankyrin repeat-containing protein [Herbaspirillum sp. CF444]|uniref:ankyrin repeat domain-containing protein n=1 Tax=Herbaspirillum sp. CF444 TaxID=1144319 RepID=UPI0002724694|nr:ankyrin repeat domain-containing protein [Herbaspirillum sp. CF444]EJL81218.1 ankyrin repeat-containing protein [Herbaspirillum sp. CF444]
MNSLRLKIVSTMFLVVVCSLGFANELTVLGKTAQDAFQDKGVVDLLRAVTRRDAKEADRLVKTGVNVNAAGYGGVTPLLWMQFNKNKDAMKLLLELGANPNQRMMPGGSPLWLAAGAGNIDLLELLLQHGADPNIPIGANSPLNEAVLGNHLDCAELLLKHGADINFHDGLNGPTVISAAVVSGRLDYVNWALDHGYTYDLKFSRRLVELERPRFGQAEQKAKALAKIDQLIASGIGTAK